MDEADGIRKKTMNGVPTKLKLVLSYANRFYEELWKKYQSDLKSIGVELVLRFYTTPEFFKSMDLGKLDMWAMGWNEDIYEPDLSRSWHSRVPGKEAFGSHNYGGYSNKMVDRLIEEGMYTSNRKKRNQLLMQAGRLIADDVPALFLFDEKYYRTAMSPHLTRTSLSQRFGMGIENLVKLANLPSNLKSKEAENVAK
jgi:ABC-type transport system substrate-binding protein